MDDLIGGLLALMVGLVILTLALAAAFAAFVTGTAGGALLGLGQGSLAFISDLSRSVTSRGRARRQPLAPEPAFQLYVLGQLKTILRRPRQRLEGDAEIPRDMHRVWPPL